MRTLDDVFDAFGGPAAVGRVLGKSTEHAASMRRRGSIPVEYWPVLLSAAHKQNIDHLTYEALVLIHSRRMNFGSARPKSLGAPKSLGIAPPGGAGSLRRGSRGRD
jgi:hypothetical protein